MSRKCIDRCFAICVLTGIVLYGDGKQACAAEPFAAEELAGFERDVLPILKEHCFKCHAGAEIEGGLRMNSRDALLGGGDSGPAIDLENLEQSALLAAIRYEGPEMPPTGKLPPELIDTLTKWVTAGAPMPAGEIAYEAPHSGTPQVNDETKSHWAFQPVSRPQPPDVVNGAWVENEIDAFVLARLEAASFSPAPPADRRALIRRAYYDLLGLPPEPADVEAFAADNSPNAWPELVERLLDSPQYGEHWARYWLDLVRYAETNSYERDNPKPFVWRYRDYVIDAFNSDKPYDEFIIEQLAGDELEDRSAEHMIATGYYRLGLWDDEPADPELAFYDGLDDIAATTAQAFLGLTMNCARCHDHKLDPIPQSDYYSFIAFFRNVRHYGVRGDDTVFDASVCDISMPAERDVFESQLAEYQDRVAELRKDIDAVEERVLAQLTGGEKDDFQDDGVRQRIVRRHIGELLTQSEYDEYAHDREEWRELKESRPRSAAQALCVKEHGTAAPDTHVLGRGSPQSKGDVVEPAFPAVLSPPAPIIRAVSHGDSTGRRRALAEWIASPANPLTARVMVNRLWQWHFGRGLVRSTSNFGLTADAPTHPELLEWLAGEFTSSGWSIKHMHRVMMLSSTYQQGSGVSSQGSGVSERADAVSVGSGSASPQPSTLNPQPWITDPQNDLFWRFDMRRLRAEEVRDSLLAINGSLNLTKMHGPSIYEEIPAEVLAGQSRPGYGWGDSTEEDRRRRSIYIHVKRSLQVPLLAAFDAADADFTCPVRFATTQPTQALSMLNSEYVNQQAGVFADYVRTEAGDDLASQIRLALHRATQRPPTDTEVTRGST